MSTRPVRPVYLKTARHTIFGLFHTPESTDPTKAAVLVCPPWGWDETASYRTRRGWAQRLAGAGHPTLRFDLPGTGNSSGSPRDPNLLEEWVLATKIAAVWLRASSGCSHLAALGLGLGGLLAMESLVMDTPIDELALWATPAAGRNFARETRAFSRLQPWAAQAESGGLSLPDGWLEAGGFVLSAETLEALRTLDPEPAANSSLRRVLLLGRDGIDADNRLRERLQGAGATVTVETGRGWTAMVSHPEHSTIPLEVADRLEGWLDSGDEPSSAVVSGTAGGAGELPQAPGPAEVPELHLDVGGHRVSEVALVLEQPWGRAFGVLVAPVEDRIPGVGAVFLNAGAVRNIGPNRMWVETSRALAARGVPTLRVDLQGIGDADGEPGGVLRLADFYEPRYEAQVEAVLDALEERESITSFMLVGLCAGGYLAFRAAVSDERVRAAAVLNAGALRWHADLLAEREARKAYRAFERRSWRKLIRGDIKLATLPARAGSLLTVAGRSMLRLGRLRMGGGTGEALVRDIEADLNRLRDTGTRLLIAFSDGEPMGVEFEAGDLAARVGSWPNVELTSLPGGDHTLRPIAAQIAAGELLERELDRAAFLEPQRPAGP